MSRKYIGERYEQAPMTPKSSSPGLFTPSPPSDEQKQFLEFQQWQAFMSWKAMQQGSTPPPPPPGFSGAAPPGPFAFPPPSLHQVTPPDSGFLSGLSPMSSVSASHVTLDGVKPLDDVHQKKVTPKRKKTEDVEADEACDEHSSENEELKAAKFIIAKYQKKPSKAKKMKKEVVSSEDEEEDESPIKPKSKPKPKAKKVVDEKSAKGKKRKPVEQESSGEDVSVTAVVPPKASKKGGKGRGKANVTPKQT